MRKIKHLAMKLLTDVVTILCIIWVFPTRLALEEMRRDVLRMEEAKSWKDRKYKPTICPECGQDSINCHHCQCWDEDEGMQCFECWDAEESLSLIHI